MKEHPILFSGPMVRAILDGRKTQTRRIIRSNTGPPPDIVHRKPGPTMSKYWCEPGGWVRCPYGKPGDRLWVRETWRTGEMADGHDGVWYAADGKFRGIENTKAAADAWVKANAGGKHDVNWRPSIHMPRWASRITLEVTDVRVERVQAISELDAMAEGVTPPPCPSCCPPTGRREGFWEAGSLGPCCTDCMNTGVSDSFTNTFADLWNTINAKRAPWSSNPWVWVVSFRRVQP